MQVSDEEIAIMFFLELYPVLDRPDKVPQMKLAGWLDPRQNTLLHVLIIAYQV